MGNSSNEIRFNHGLTTILRMIQGNEVTLSGPAMRLLSRIMHLFNKKLVDKFTAKVHNGNGKKVNEIRIAQQIIENTVSKNLLQYALAEGQKAVMKFQTGVLVYKPKQVGKKRKIKVKRVSMAKEFVTSVAHVFSQVCPGQEVEPKVKRAIANATTALCVLMAKQARILAGPNNVVTPLHMKQVVDSVLARSMAAHANSEGTKFTFMYEKGLIHLKPELLNTHAHKDNHKVHHPHPHAHNSPPDVPNQEKKRQIPANATPAPKTKKSKK